MTFTVETGDGLSNANSYVSVAEADSYHLSRNNTDWAKLTNTKKEAALLYATSYIDAKFDFPGYIKLSTQSLAWPRSSAYDNENRTLTGVPNKLKEAVCELALVHATEEKINATFDRGGEVKSEQIGPIEIVYKDSAPAGVTYPFLEQILTRLIVTGSMNVINLVRS